MSEPCGVATAATIPPNASVPSTPLDSGSRPASTGSNHGKQITARRSTGAPVPNALVNILTKHQANPAADRRDPVAHRVAGCQRPLSSRESSIQRGCNPSSPPANVLRSGGEMRETGPTDQERGRARGNPQRPTPACRWAGGAGGHLDREGAHHRDSRTCRPAPLQERPLSAEAYAGPLFATQQEEQ